MQRRNPEQILKSCQSPEISLKLEMMHRKGGIVSNRKSECYGEVLQASCIRCPSG